MVNQTCEEHIVRAIVWDRICNCYALLMVTQSKYLIEGLTKDIKQPFSQTILNWGQPFAQKLASKNRNSKHKLSFQRIRSEIRKPIYENEYTLSNHEDLQTIYSFRASGDCNMFFWACLTNVGAENLCCEYRAAEVCKRRISSRTRNFLRRHELYLDTHSTESLEAFNK